MIQSEQDCEAVLTQILAAKSALNQVSMHVIGFSMKRCLGDGSDYTRDELIEEALGVFLRYRGLGRAGEPEAPGPADPADLTERLQRLEARLHHVQELVGAHEPECEEVISALGYAAGDLNDVSIRVLGYSMRLCLVEEAGATREDLIDEAIAVFLKYSSCVR
jgi:DNA-binding FrmR family transcriptional regulator